MWSRWEPSARVPRPAGLALDELDERRPKRVDDADPPLAVGAVVRLAPAQPDRLRQLRHRCVEVLDDEGDVVVGPLHGVLYAALPAAVLSQPTIQDELSELFAGGYASVPDVPAVRALA